MLLLLLLSLLVPRLLPLHNGVVPCLMVLFLRIVLSFFEQVLFAVAIFGPVIFGCFAYSLYGEKQIRILHLNTQTEIMPIHARASSAFCCFRESFVCVLSKSQSKNNARSLFIYIICNGCVFSSECL